MLIISTLFQPLIKIYYFFYDSDFLHLRPPSFLLFLIRRFGEERGDIKSRIWRKCSVVLSMARIIGFQMSSLEGFQKIRFYSNMGIFELKKNFFLLVEFYKSTFVSIYQNMSQDQAKIYGLSQIALVKQLVNPKKRIG